MELALFGLGLLVFLSKMVLSGFALVVGGHMAVKALNRKRK